LQYLYTFDYTVPDDIEESIAYSQARKIQQKALASIEQGSEAQESSVAESVADQAELDAPYGGDRDLTGLTVDSSARIGSNRLDSHADYLWRMYHRSIRPRPELYEDPEPVCGELSALAEECLQEEYDSRALSPMLFHINVYALADRVQIEALKKLAEKNFGALAKKEWKSPDFASAIEEIYSVAPPGTAGDSLRKMIVRLVVSHAKELFSLDRGFMTMLQNTPEFAADLARALSGAGVSSRGAEVNVDMEELRCLGCKFTMKASLSPDVAMLTCPVCKWDGIVSRWRHGSKDQGVLKKGRRSISTTNWEL
jgi:hypothetical protein